MNKLKYFLYAVILIGICLACIVVFSKLLDKDGGSKSGETLTTIGTIVAVSAMVSIAIALFTYLESSVIAKRIDKAKEDLKASQGKVEERYAETLRKMVVLREVYYGLAMLCIKGFREAFMVLPPSEKFKEVMRSMDQTEIDVQLASGTYEGLRSAVESLYKKDVRKFLDIQEELWNSSDDLKNKERDDIRNCYMKLKKCALDKLT